MRNKHLLTQTLLDQLPPGHGLSVRDVCAQWWFNIRAGGGMRLTQAGYNIMTQLEIEHWSIELDPMTFDKHLILMLDRNLQAPYYVEVHKKIPRKIIMFSSKEAMMANLYGDVKTWLLNLQSVGNADDNDQS